MTSSIPPSSLFILELSPLQTFSHSCKCKISPLSMANRMCFRDSDPTLVSVKKPFILDDELLADSSVCYLFSRPKIKASSFGISDSDWEEEGWAKYFNQFNDLEGFNIDDIPGSKYVGCYLLGRYYGSRMFLGQPEARRPLAVFAIQTFNQEHDVKKKNIAGCAALKTFQALVGERQYLIKVFCCRPKP